MMKGCQKMKIHKVRSPFMCREGQFTPGKRELCVGLDYNTLKSTNEFWCYLGKNKKTHYEIDSARALEIGHSWTNPKGKTVIILPLSEFKKVDSNWDKEEHEEKEIKRANLIARALYK